MSAVPVTVVTGANGFLASHIVRILLEKGHIVHGTVRNPHSPKCAHVKDLPGASERLKLFKAELLAPGAFDEAIAGATGVIHTASPVLGGDGDPEKDIIEPAREGTLNVLRSVASVGKSVRAVVLTSSTYATDPMPVPTLITEKDWSDAEQQKSAKEYYGASKTIAEKTAWEFIESLPDDARPRFVTILPAGIMGPSLSKEPLGSYVGYMLQLVKAGMPEISNDYMAFVDVRDCAAHHVAGLELLDAEGRYLSVGGSWHLKDVFAAFKAAHPEMPGSIEFKGEPMTPANYDVSKMQTLGVPTRTMGEIIVDLVQHFRDRGEL